MFLSSKIRLLKPYRKSRFPRKTPVHHSKQLNKNILEICFQEDLYNTPTRIYSRRGFGVNNLDVFIASAFKTLQPGSNLESGISAKYVHTSGPLANTCGLGDLFAFRSRPNSFQFVEKHLQLRGKHVFQLAAHCRPTLSGLYGLLIRLPQ